MSYPLSSPVTSGQPTFAAHYNNLRLDALSFGQAEADVVPPGTFLKRFAQGITLVYLATNRLRIPYNPLNPPTLMINGCMLQTAANVDLPAGLFSGLAATWYIFAVRTPGSTTFTLSVNTSPIETTDQRLIGQCTWDGIKVTFVYTTVNSDHQLTDPDYDSGWFAVACNSLFTKAHGLLQWPRLVVLLHSNVAEGNEEWIPVTVIQNGANVEKSAYGWSSANVYCSSGVDLASSGTCWSTRRASNVGYWRVLAWK